MLLYLDENEFAVFRSEDLRNWKETQRFSFERMWECPDLLRLKADDSEKTEKWVFWSADGFYVIGRFDGYRFEAQSEVLKAYDTDLPYAAQTISGAMDRTISIAWLRTADESGNYRGMMSVPTEVFLKKGNHGYRVAFRPAEEVQKYMKMIPVSLSAGEQTEIQLQGEPVMLQIQGDKTGERQIKAGGKEIVIRKPEGTTTLIVDAGIIEYFSNGGLVYGCVEVDRDVLRQKIRIAHVPLV